MLSILMLFAGLSLLHPGNTAKTQTKGTIEEYLLEYDLSRSNLYMIAPEIRKAPETAGQPLPLIQIFTTDGKLIFQEEGNAAGMRARIEDAMQKRLPIEGGIAFKDELAQLRSLDGKKVDPLDLPTATFTFIDHWNVACTDCRPQMRHIESIASANKDKTIAILKVSWDEIKQ